MALHIPEPSERREPGAAVPLALAPVSCGNQHPRRIMRLKQIIAPNGVFPVSKSAWYAGIAEGRYPKPVRLGPGMVGWRDTDIERLIISAEAA
ncbi:AlpA family phage regulatory protein [Minwuia sp. IMCC4030]|uniref:helix-turn-helix transcriptional regulator n=1 Tax=Minwuia sp. IMCC4030 TaxID=3040677 RepID=UPI0024797464|nr:AlpA family phage regulatory protein [Minwuia sp. IMCC4030]